VLKAATLKRWTWQGKRRWLTLAVLALLLFKVAPWNENAPGPGEPPAGSGRMP